MSFHAVDGQGTQVLMNAVGDGSSTPYAAGTSLAYVGAAAFALGQTTAAGSLPVVICSNQGNIAINVAAVGGTALALGQALMAASLPVAFASDQSRMPVNVNQIGGAALAFGSAVSASSIPIVIASDQVKIPVNITFVGGTAFTLGSAVSASSISVVVASDQTLASNITKVGGSALALGQAAMAASVPVTLATNQTNVPTNVAQVNGSTVATAASGIQKVGLCDGAGVAVPLGQGLMAASVPVCIASNQGNLPANIAAVGGSALAIGQATMAASFPVAIANNQSNLPANVTQVGGVALAFGQAVMASSLPVCIASNQGAVPGNTTQIAGSSIAVAATGIAKVGLCDGAGTAIPLGQAAMAASIPVCLSSNQGALTATVSTARGSVTTYASAVSLTGSEADLASGISNLGNYSRLIAQVTLVITGSPTGGSGAVICQVSLDGVTWFDVAVFSVPGNQGNQTVSAMMQAAVLPVTTVLSGGVPLSRSLTTAQPMPLGLEVRFTGVNSMTGGTPAIAATVKYQAVA